MLELETKLDNIDNFGLTTAFNQFKESLQLVSLERPDAMEMASLVRNQAENIAAMLRNYHADLSRLLENNVVELENSMGAANILIDKIVEYNRAITGQYITDAGRISRGEGVSQYGPLEMIDQRNLLLDELAQYGNIEVFQNVNGSVRVTMAGVTIIDDEFSEKLVMRDYSDFNAAVLTFSNGVEFRPNTGELKGYMDMLNGNGSYAVGAYQNSEFGIPYYMHALDAFAEGFAMVMNQVIHGDITDPNQFSRSLLWAGYEYNDDGTPRMAVLRDENGIPMLDDNNDVIMVRVRARVGAANIRVSEEWRNNELLISETYGELLDDDGNPTGEFGWRTPPNLDGVTLHRFVRALEDARQWGSALDFHGSVFEYLQFISNRLGQSIDFVENQLDVTLDTVFTLLDNRDAISSVCETEEGVNMMTYQKWFNASARLMTTMDEALDTIINRMGRVGL
jgi:flagellar hook-associated protein 1 FlgK